RSARPLAEQGPGGVDARLGHVVHPAAEQHFPVGGGEGEDQAVDAVGLPLVEQHQHLAAEPLRGDHATVTLPLSLRHVLALPRRGPGLGRIDQALIADPCWPGRGEAGCAHLDTRFADPEAMAVVRQYPRIARTIPPYTVMSKFPKNRAPN